MVMKRYVLLIIIAVLSLMAISCKESFLEEYPDTSLTSGTFFKTSTHFEQALVASYVGLRRIAEDGVFMDEMRSDNAFFTYYSGDRGPSSRTEVIAEFLDDESTGNWILDRYRSDYSMISRTNTILDRLDASELDENEKSSVRAEALFLRAFYYFDLVQHWGGVPLMLHEVVSESQAYVAKSSIEETYNQILSDVSEAISLGLPLASSFPQSGRATMGAAKMLRA